ncbi:alpha/beta fold hydrolase [Vibrio aquimaris]|uniref:Aminoacrylate hydrolase RutD n=1 Tax=Vibrio aquimaris TaxID=2587862 RepID=A0A5P9CRK0_9VIBR|nr:alpha/beta hydrolase [Vibrio aquimaris]QFT28417.1 Putative aminoacrylate hydrolase RutD [Vibrio aquimaris]
MPDMIYDHFRCIFIYHRGFAECNRDVAHGDASLEKISSDTEAILQNLGVETSWVLGHSGHTYMALDFCHRYPNKVLGCAIVGTALWV